MDQQSIDMRSLWGVLQRRVRLIIVVFVIILALASAIIFTLKPSFTAAALVMVEHNQQDLLDLDTPTTTIIDGARVERSRNRRV